MWLPPDMPEMPSSPRTIDFYFKTMINNLLLLLPLECPQEWGALQESCESKELGWALNDVPVSAGVRRKPSGLSALENALPSAACGRKKEINLLCFRLLRKKLLWQSRRRRELSKESKQGQRRKLPKKPKKPGLGTSAKQTRMMRANGDKKKVKIK